MAVDERTPARVSLPRTAWIGMSLFGVVMLGLLGGQFLLIHQQRDIAQRQERLARTQLRDIRPVTRSARPLAEEALRGLPRATAIALRVDRLAREATPLVAELRAAGLRDAARDLETLTRNVVAAIANGRLERALRSTITVLGTVRATHLVARLAQAVPRLDRTQKSALSILRQSLSIQRETLRTNRENLATAQATLAVARATLSHAASVDDKLAGPLLGTGGR